MKKKNNQLLMLLSAVGLMAFTACTDDKYDLSDIDMTIGVGSDEGLRLPTSSTKKILLEDLLELNNSETVVTRENGDYVFQQKGSEIDPVHPRISKVFISSGTTTNIPVQIEVPDLPDGYELLPVGTPLTGTANSIRKEIQTFNYEDTYPEEIKSLKTAEMEGNIDVEITFTEDLNGFISEFKTFDVEFPQYMEIVVTSAPQSYTLEGNLLKFKNVPTNKPLTIKVDITSLDFTESDENPENVLKLENGKVRMIGNLKVDAAYNDAVKGSGNINNLWINSEMKINGLTIVGATGSFSPQIEITDIGEVTLNDLPDFLTDDDVVVDLYNPQILINIQSDLSIPGFLKGKLIAKDENGSVISTVDVPEVKINAVEENGGLSNILICRRDENIPEGITYVAPVANLSDIIRKIPYTISFETEARADDSRDDSYLKLDHDYTITPSYSIEAPLAFGPDARIVYNDTLDGWNEDVQDLEFASNAYVRVTADIENCIPAYLRMKARAIDVDGKEMSDVKVTVDGNIAASEDGSTPKSSPITIKIEQNGKNGLKNLDGIIFSIEASASEGGNTPIVGQTLNAKKHNLTAKNIEVTVMGKVVIKDED